MTRARAALLALVMVAAGSAGPATATAGVGDGPCAEPTMVGTPGRDVLRGTPGPDVIHGLGGDDRLLGGDGDDVLCGGAGQDVLRGGDGHDQLYGGRDARVAEDNDYWVMYGDELAGGPGDDVLVPGADPRGEGPNDRVSYLRSATGVVVDLAEGTATGEGTDTIRGPLASLVGSAHDDQLRGTEGGDVISGVAGADVVEGRGGMDVVVSGLWSYLDDPPVDEHGDLLDGGAGRDEVLGEAGDDQVVGGPGSDALYGARGLDRLVGGRGGDRLFDTLEPGEGQALVGGPGTDGVEELWFATPAMREGDIAKDVIGRLDLAAGTLSGTFDGTRVEASVVGVEDAFVMTGRWTLLGTDGPNRLSGDDERGVVLRGRGGDDVLSGWIGDDVLDGGPGHDSGWGWRGRDRYLSIEDRR